MGNQWFILSAKHGLIDPNKVISDYDETLVKMPISQRIIWADKVLKELLPLLRKGDKVIFFAGQTYREFLEGPLKENGIIVEVPTEKLAIGYQLQWLDKRKQELLS
jgi:hypothetical protein